MRIVTRSAPALVGAMLMVAGAAAADEAVETSTPAFRVEQDTVDVGQVRAGDTAEAVFHFLNTGEADVRILRAKPS